MTSTWTGYTTEEKEEEIDKIRTVLWHYLLPQYRRVCDFEDVIENRQALTVDGSTVYQYDCPGQTIYLREDYYPVTYGNQVVNKEFDAYYYNFAGSEDAWMECIASYEWKRNSLNDG